ncbi:MAG TPA: M56 family metallopeptidase, partial [Gillisia sp.]|nr:M56 family metallopeptidase [Gillisia sp.]
AHEEAHASQLHSLDVLLMEILQIVLWFNPLIYLAKDAVKLNHEFLADQTVLKNGMEASNYQRTLLAFSSNAPSSKLANALNYSSIKKRFTVMKTHTSKASYRGRSLLLLPLMALLIYGFSDKEVVVKNAAIFGITTPFQDTIPNKKLILNIDEELIIVNGKITNLKNFAKTINEITSDWTKEDFGLHGLEINVGDNVGNAFIEQINTEYLKTNLAKSSAGNLPFIPKSGSFTSNLLKTPSAPPKMEDYLTDNSNIYLDEKIISTEEAINLINTRGEELTVSLKENGKKKATVTLEFKGNIPPPPPPTAAPEATQMEIELDGESGIMPPPPPPVPTEHMKELAEKGAVFFFEGKEISGKEAIRITKEIKSINIQVREINSEKPIVKLSKDPIVVD